MTGFCRYQKKDLESRRFLDDTLKFCLGSLSVKETVTFLSRQIGHFIKLLTLPKNARPLSLYLFFNNFSSIFAICSMF